MDGVAGTEGHREPRGRLTMLGRRTDDGGECALVVVQEADGSWSFHGPVSPAGPEEPGVRLEAGSVAVMVEAIGRRR
ncbi:MAG: hypothetical protein ACRDSZ_23270 [Pseudonocardiaceae bacterium]